MSDRQTQLNQGLALSLDGKTLFVSSVDKVYAYTYDATTGTATYGKVIIGNMANGGHSTRTLLISKSNPDLLLVSRGSAGNIDPLAGNISTGHSTIKYFRISDIMNSPADHAQGGTVLGWGLRNSVGVGEHPITGGIVSDDCPMTMIWRGSLTNAPHSGQSRTRWTTYTSRTLTYTTPTPRRR